MCCCLIEPAIQALPQLADMDMGKRMMEKWGWSKGQGRLQSRKS